MCKISVVIVCKNEEKYIEETLKSVLQQTFTDFECIVMDGLSEDNTLSILYEMQKVDSRIRVYSQKDLGIYHAMNNGIKKTKGEYIYFLNVRDSFFDNYVLEHIIDSLHNEDADLLIGQVCYQRRVEPMLVGVESLEKMMELVKGESSICHQAVIAKRTCFMEGFDLRYRIASDYDWLCRQVVSKKRIRIIDCIIANYDSYGFSGLAYNRKELWKEFDEIYSNYFKEVFPEEKKRQRINDYRNFKNNQMISEWLWAKQMGKQLNEILIEDKIKTVAIYGFSKMGKLLYHELENSDILVKYAIDKRDLICELQPIVVYKPCEELPNVDAIIVTPVIDYIEIKTFLESKLKCHVFSLENLINELYES